MEPRSPEMVEADALVLARVKRGIAVLDQELGPDWVERIDPANLILSDTRACVLGQLYGDYDDGVYELGLGDGDEKELGFNIIGPIFDRTTRDWKVLTAFWRSEIALIHEQRRGGDGMNIGQEQAAIRVEPLDVPVREEERVEEPVVVEREEERVPA